MKATTQLIPAGRNIFALGMVALGVICFISGDFIIGRPPAWSADFSLNPWLAYGAGAIVIFSAIAILSKKSAGLAATLISMLILFLSTFRHLPHFMNDWVNAYKSMALLGGGLIVAASFVRDGSLGIAERTRKIFIIIGTLAMSAFFIACGYAHFKFAEFVKDLIPAYIPFHEFWAYFCGVCLLAGGLGLLLPQTRKWAALLSGIMVGSWFLLLHIPRFLSNTSDVSDRLGVCESFTIAGIFFVLAGIFSAKK